MQLLWSLFLPLIPTKKCPELFFVLSFCIKEIREQKVIHFYAPFAQQGKEMKLKLTVLARFSLTCQSLNNFFV